MSFICVPHLAPDSRAPGLLRNQPLDLLQQLRHQLLWASWLLINHLPCLLPCVSPTCSSREIMALGLCRQQSDF
ncbi:mCG1043868 [Mus musculus]|nr:mCG1043868 [Mus musculus]